MEFSNKRILIILLIKNILEINGVESLFLGSDFLSVNKNNIEWEDIKHIVISLINEFFEKGNQLIVDKNLNNKDIKDYKDIEKKLFIFWSQK